MERENPMADRITARNTETKYTAHPEGQFVSQCVDAIDLGEKVQDYPGTPKYLSHKCALVFRTGEKNEAGDFIDVSAEFTVSMHEKSKLRPFLEGWRGRAYTAEEADEGVPIDKLCGKWALIQVGQQKSAKGRTYAIIMTAMGVPKSMELPTFGPYTRADFWEERRKEYQKEADQFRAEIGATLDGNENVSGSDDMGGDDDLPF